MSRRYEQEFKNKIVRLRLEERRTYKSIAVEYGISKTAIQSWCDVFSKECQAKSQDNPDTANEAELMKENLRLRRKLDDNNPLSDIVYMGLTGISRWLFI